MGVDSDAHVTPVRTAPYCLCEHDKHSVAWCCQAGRHADSTDGVVFDRESLVKGRRAVCALVGQNGRLRLYLDLTILQTVREKGCPL